MLSSTCFTHNKNRFSWRLWFVWFCERCLRERTKKANCWIWLLCEDWETMTVSVFKSLFFFALYTLGKCPSYGLYAADQRFPTLDNRKHLCAANDSVCMCVCNQPLGTEWILPAHDGDALQCNGCSTGFPKSQSPRIRRGMKEKRGIRMAFIGLWLPLS